MIDVDKITNVKCSGIDMEDYPDFCDSYIESADYNGEPMTEEQLEIINQDYGYVYDAVMTQLF